MNNKEVKKLLFNDLNILKKNIENKNYKNSYAVNDWLSKQLKNNQKPNIKLYQKIR